MKKTGDPPCVGRCKPISIGALLSMLVDVAVKRGNYTLKREKAVKQMEHQATSTICSLSNHSKKKTGHHHMILTTVAIKIGQ